MDFNPEHDYVCAWCWKPATKEFEVRPGSYTYKRGIKEPTKLPYVVPVCDACDTRLRDNVNSDRQR